jgi:ABC-type lipoprotein release transport system permease subunit
VTVSGALVVVALAACFAPARRAVGIQPAAVLRND